MLRDEAKDVTWSDRKKAERRLRQERNRDKQSGGGKGSEGEKRNVSSKDK